jgi:hypothetical protein
VDEDGGVGGILQLLSLVFLIDHFDDEQLLTHLFMAISKEIITVEALDILTSAGDLR